MKKRTIQFNKRNISIITHQITHNYYIPKNLPSYPYIRLPSRIPKIARSSSAISLNTFSNYNSNKQFNSNDIFGIDFPYDNYNKQVVYSGRIYSINLSKKKRRRKFY